MIKKWGYMKKVFFICMAVVLLVSQNATISVQNLVGDINRLSLNDFDALGTGNTRPLLRVNGSVNTTAQIYFVIGIEKDNETIVEVVSKHIRNHAGFSNISFDNTEITNGLTIIDKNAKPFAVKIERTNVKSATFFDGSSVTTTLPDGSYRFYFQIKTGTTVLAEDDFTLTLESNHRFELLSPMDGATISSVLAPRLEWSTDNTWKSIIIEVYEAMGTSNNLDGKLITSIPVFNEPALIRSGNRFILDFNNPKLAYVKTRFSAAKSDILWVVSGYILSVNGYRYIESEVSRFSVKDPSSEGGDTTIDGILRRLLPEQFDQIKKAFESMTLEEIRMNGKVMTKDEFIKYVNSIDVTSRTGIIAEFDEGN